MPGFVKQLDFKVLACLNSVLHPLPNDAFVSLAGKSTQPSVKSRQLCGSFQADFFPSNSPDRILPPRTLPDSEDLAMPFWASTNRSCSFFILVQN